MKRQKITIGSILEIDIESNFFYAQILGKAGYVFFDIKLTESIKDLKILDNVKPLFFTSVYNDVINLGKWVKVGKLPIRDEFLKQPLQFIHWPHDKVKWGIYDPNTGEIRNSTKEECRSLELAAVYDDKEVEERLLDHFSGKINRYRQKDLQLFEESS
jgi:hypothetical protein